MVFAADKDSGSIGGSILVETSGGPKPVANAEVRLTFGSKSESRRTGADGKFVFPDLLPGKYTIKVTPPDGLKPKGDGTVTVTLAAGGNERADFGLVAPATPTPAPKVTPTVSPVPKPSSGQNSPGQNSAGQNSASQNSAAAPAAVVQPGTMPPLVIPFASPQTASSQTAGQATPGPTTASSNGQSDPRAAAGVAISSPAPLLFSTPGVIVAAASPTPGLNPAGTRTTVPGDDVLASGPPRRLVTSFEALRQTAGGSAAAQLKSWATENSLVLGVPFRTQIDGTSFSLVNCGPASLAMILVAFGMDVDAPSVRDYLNHLVGNYDTEAGTSLYVLARIAREAGLSVFGTSAGLQGWTVEQIREHVRAGHPVITLTKYRFLPGHFGSVTDFDHYIVITGLAGEDFVYNDAAYSTEYGYNLLISPAQLERAWAASSVPRHAMAVGFGDSLRPLPIVPRRLTAEALAATAPAEDVNAVVAEAPVRVTRGPAAEWLREQTLDRLGARTAVVDGDPGITAQVAPPTRLDPSEAAILERPSGSALADPVRRAAVEDIAAVPVPADQQASDLAASAAGAIGDGVAQAVVDARTSGADDATGGPVLLSPLALALMTLGLLLTVGGGVVGWRRREARAWVVRGLKSTSTFAASLRDAGDGRRRP